MGYYLAAARAFGMIGCALLPEVGYAPAAAKLRSVLAFLMGSTACMLVTLLGFIVFGAASFTIAGYAAPARLGHARGRLARHHR